MPKYLIQFDVSIRMNDSEKNAHDVLEVVVTCEHSELFKEIKKKKQLIENIAHKPGDAVEYLSISLKNYFEF